ncbi:MAG: hypothetical protein KGJ74_07525 [Betaproteobacteria bacterium]|nr:hypothetical protein [Betaproteobacteria bacterium]
MNDPLHPTSNSAPASGAPREAHQTAVVQIPEATLRKHYLSGEFFITQQALEAHDIDEVLRWFNLPHEPVIVGDTRGIGSNGLKAFFGFDDSKPMRKALFVRIY